eukprot:3492619-Pleurochrysis_carterae.AAC.1
MPNVHSTFLRKNSKRCDQHVSQMPMGTIKAFHAVLLAIDVQESELLAGVQQRAVAEGGEQLVPLCLRLVICVAVKGLGRVNDFVGVEDQDVEAPG